MKYAEFTPTVITRESLRGNDAFQGAGAIRTTDVAFCVYEAWGFPVKESLDVYKVQPENIDATLFSYMFRRFGTPVDICDEYKQIGQWLLTTPMDGLYLSVHPFMGMGFGYISTRQGFMRDIWLQAEKPRTEWRERFTNWAKETHDFNSFTTCGFGFFSLETTKEGEYIKFVKNERFAIAWKEYEAWVDGSTPERTDNIPTGQQEMMRFIGPFNKHKEQAIDEMRKIYAEIEPAPLHDGDSELLNEAITAIKYTAKHLLKYTYVRDVYFNALGWENEAMDATLSREFGEDETSVEYTDPNTTIGVYQKGLLAPDQKAE